MNVSFLSRQWCVMSKLGVVQTFQFIDFRNCGSTEKKRDVFWQQLRKTLIPMCFSRAAGSPLEVHELPNTLPPPRKLLRELLTGSEGHGISRLGCLVSSCHSLAWCSCWYTWCLCWYTCIFHVYIDATHLKMKNLTYILSLARWYFNVGSEQIC